MRRFDEQEILNDNIKERKSYKKEYIFLLFYWEL
jgi:hypothetical protein